MEVQLDLEAIRQRKLMIFTPLFTPSRGYFQSMLALHHLLSEYGIDAELHQPANQSDIPWIRNKATDVFLRSDCTDLLQIDNDIAFDPMDILALMHFDKDVIGANCPRKQIDWNLIREAVLLQPDISPDKLQLMGATWMAVVSPDSPDEDYWFQSILPVPVPASLYQRLPYAVSLRDVEEIPAGRLFGQDDEDFWQNPVAPVAASLYQRLPLGDPEELPAGSLFGQDDEDFWRNPTAPVAASLKWPQQYLFGDQSDVPSGSLKKFNAPDEDYWQNRVAPVQATLYQPLPYAFDAAAESTEFEFGTVATTQAPQSLSAIGDVTGGQALGGGISWPYPPLSTRHWSAPPSSKLKIEKAPEEQPKPQAISGTVATVQRPAKVQAAGEVANPVSGKSKTRSRKDFCESIAKQTMAGDVSARGKTDFLEAKAEHRDIELEIILALISEM
jgi:hypothetical protein